jgi:hypothetical protein
MSSIVCPLPVAWSVVGKGSPDQCSQQGSGQLCGLSQLVVDVFLEGDSELSCPVLLIGRKSRP